MNELNGSSSEGVTNRINSHYGGENGMKAGIWPFFREQPPHHHEKPKDKMLKITWRSFLGSMPDIDQIYHQESFLRNWKRLKFVLIFIDSVLRGISQVMFANNPLTGLIIMVGLFYGNWEISFYALLGTIMSTMTAHLFQFSYSGIRAGLYGYNGCLATMAIINFTFPRTPQIIPPVIFISMFSTVFYQAICQILVRRLSIPPFTFSFQVSAWIWLLGSLKYRYFPLDGTVVSPQLLSTRTIKPSLSDISYARYTVEDIFSGFFTSIAQVFFIDNPYSGVVILVAVAVCSRILSLFILIGAVSGQLIAAYVLGLPAPSVLNGLWGFNTILTCEALGGMFFVLDGYRIWIFTLYAAFMTIFVQGALSSFLSTTGMPTFTFPFTFICWTFCLIGNSKSLIRVTLSDCNIPEEHRYRYRLWKFVQKQMKQIIALTTFSSSVDQDITNRQLSILKKEFIPKLIFTSVYRNDWKNLQVLSKKNVNFRCSDAYGRTALHLSVCQGSLKITQWLIEKRHWDVNALDHFGHTPLWDALMFGQFHLIDYLYSHGARLPTSNNTELAFYFNGFVYENNLQAMKYFIQCGFDPNQGDFEGRNALHIAVQLNAFHLVRYLVENTTISLDHSDRFEQTPHQYAVKSNYEEISNYLLQKRENVSPRKLSVVVETSNSVKMENPIESMSFEQNLLPSFLLLAAQEDDQKEKLRKFNSDHPGLRSFECTNYDHRSLAHLAAIESQLNAFQLMYESMDADTFRKMLLREDRWGLTPEDYALIHRNHSILNFIRDHVPKDNHPCLPASSLENSSSSTTMTQLNRWKKTYLFLTLSVTGQVQRIESLLLRSYFIPDHLYSDYDGRTPMHLAVAYRHRNLVQLLLRDGFDQTTCRDRWGLTPIDIAKENNDQEIIQLLDPQML